MVVNIPVQLWMGFSDESVDIIDDHDGCDSLIKL